MNINFEYIDPFDEKYDYLFRIEHLARYYFAAEELNRFEKVLDVACANGYGTQILSQKALRVIGVDKNKEYLKIAEHKYSNKNIEFNCIDVDRENIEGLFDGIVCFETLEHLKYPEKLLKNLYNILTNNGTMILSVPNSNYEVIENGKNKDPFHLHIFEYNEIIDLIEKSGFIIEKVYGQSYTNKIVNKEIEEYELTNLVNDAKTIAYPNEEDINKTYSYIFVLKKRTNE